MQQSGSPHRARAQCDSGAPAWCYILQQKPALQGPQAPVAGMQDWGAVQLTGVPARQTPVVQASAPLHRSVSAHDVPSTTDANTQPPVAGLQAFVVQGLLSSHTSGVPEAEHTPEVQVSVPSQRSASAHDVPSLTGANRQPPVAGLHESVVHGLPSLQATGVPLPEHTPEVHVS